MRARIQVSGDGFQPVQFDLYFSVTGFRSWDSLGTPLVYKRTRGDVWWLAGNLHVPDITGARTTWGSYYVNLFRPWPAAVFSKESSGKGYASAYEGEGVKIKTGWIDWSVVSLKRTGDFGDGTYGES